LRVTLHFHIAALARQPCPPLPAHAHPLSLVRRILDDDILQRDARPAGAIAGNVRPFLPRPLTCHRLTDEDTAAVSCLGMTSPLSPSLCSRSPLRSTGSVCATFYLFTARRSCSVQDFSKFPRHMFMLTLTIGMTGALTPHPSSLELTEVEVMALGFGIRLLYAKSASSLGIYVFMNMVSPHTHTHTMPLIPNSTPVRLECIILSVRRVPYLSCLNSTLCLALALCIPRHRLHAPRPPCPHTR
jgi:hypothetical protein